MARGQITQANKAMQHTNKRQCTRVARWVKRRDEKNVLHMLLKINYLQPHTQSK